MKFVSFFLLIVISIFTISIAIAQEEPPLNVGLTRFEAFALNNAVRVEWDTDTELGTVGYMLKRGQGGAFAFLTNPDGIGELFIDNVGGPDQGFNYSYTDESVQNDEIYTYQLIEVTADGNRQVQAETTVKVGVEPTPTSITLPGIGNGGNNPSSNTPTASPTIQVTNTPFPTNTPQPPSTLGPTIPQPTITPRGITESEGDDPNDISSSNSFSPDNEDSPSISASEDPVDSFEQEVPETNNGVPVALAQEELNQIDPSGYPGTDSTLTEESPVDTRSAEPEFLADSSSVNDEQPLVIGSNLQISSNQESFQSSQNQEPETPPEGRLGRLYLWIAFIAALIIFSAAVIGAIVLYTRRRFSEPASNEEQIQ